MKPAGLTNRTIAWSRRIGSACHLTYRRRSRDGRLLATLAHRALGSRPWYNRGVATSGTGGQMAANPSDAPRHFYSLEEYFALENAGDARYEYWDGEIVCMSGSSLAHVQSA